MSSPLGEKGQQIPTNSPLGEKGQPDTIQHDFSGQPKSAAPGSKTPPTAEPAKAVLSKDFILLVSWHFWTIGPCLVTAILLAFNFSRYTIGTHIGPDDNSTSNILAIMQVAAKVHEITMVIGLINIAQQAMQRSLMEGGMLLGLLGAEQSLGNILFVLSKEFRAACSYGFSDNPRRKNTLLLVSVMVVVCSLCTVVGPASAVLMVPEISWSFERTFVWNKQEKPYGSYCYPYIMMDPRLGGGNDSAYWASPFYEPISDYWRNAMFMRSHSDNGGFILENTHVIHQFRDNGLPVIVNSTTSWNRTLDVDIDWKGATKFSTVVQFDKAYISLSLVDYQPLPKNDGSEVQFIADTTGIESTTVCRGRRKLSCANDSDSTGNSSDWCFMYVTTGGHGGNHLHRSQDLLLVADETSDLRLGTGRSKVWITEGLRTGLDNRFTDSIVLVFENATDSALLTVCSIFAVLKSVQAISNSKVFAAEQVNPYGDHLYYFEPTNSQTTTVPKRALLYHENWLDMIYHDTSNDGNETQYPSELINATPTPRNSSRITVNRPLKAWAESIQDAPSRKGGSFETTGFGGEVAGLSGEAGMVEVVVGGAFISILSRISPSYMQYTASWEWFTSGTWNGTDVSVRRHYPVELVPEAMIDCKYENKTLDVYHRVYGYEPGSLSKILSMVVLLIHCIVAILGTLRQFYRGSIVNAWGTVAEYGSLCLGTDAGKAIGNTSAGIKSKQTLKTLVGIRERDVPGGSEEPRSDLELVLSEAELAAKPRIMDTGKEYGIWSISRTGTGRTAPSTTPSPAP